MLTIPRILHCVWVGPRKPPMRTIQTWKDRHPDWKYRLWTNEEVFGHAVWRNQKHIDSFLTVRQWDGVADVVRYEILLKHGGMMHGADYHCLHPLDELFLDPAFDAYAVTVGETLAPLYACTPQNQLAADLVQTLEKTPKVERPPRDTGNRFMVRVVSAKPYPRLKVWPQRYLVPENADGTLVPGDEKVYAKHLWGGSRTYRNIP